MMRKAAVIIIPFLLAIIAGCSDGDGSNTKPPPASLDEDELIPPVVGGALNPPEIDPCGIPAQKQWVEESMRDYYYFYDQVPVVNLDDFATPEELIKGLRFSEKDPFSYVTDLATHQALFEEGKSFGFGYSIKRLTDTDEVRVAYVYAGSPMGLAGIKRGDIVLSLNGVTWNNMTEQQFLEIIGTQEQPNPVDFVFLDGATGATKNRVVQMAQYTINTVLTAQTASTTADDRVIAYLNFKSFLAPSAAELDSALQFFNSKGATELILDLRYNGGGRVSIARKLASLIGGTNTNGQFLTAYRYNDKYTKNNFDYSFEPEANSLNLSRVIVITTDRTASSSEIVINALKPYIDVVTIGGRTTGKPYISYSREFCEKSMNAIEAEGFNANNVSVFGGVEATCPSFDYPVTDFGYDLSGEASINELDSMLADSLRYIITGSCQTPVTTIADNGNHARGNYSRSVHIDLPYETEVTGAIEQR